MENDTKQKKRQRRPKIKAKDKSKAKDQSISGGLSLKKKKSETFTPPKKRGRRQIEKTHKEDQPLLGIIEKVHKSRAYICPIHRKERYRRIEIEGVSAEDLKDGDIAYFENTNEMSSHKIIGHITDPDIYIKITILRHEIRHEFSHEIIHQAEGGGIPKPNKKRVDLRDIPFVTIDGSDAKDFDDAVFATPLDNGEWRILVAIADVSYYVTPNTLLDVEAQKRGNSVYLPGTVVPMLPEALSNELCSLKPNVDRAALCVEMIVSKEGKVLKSKFMRALIKSCARLTYEDVEKAIQGTYTDITRQRNNEILNLFNAYKVLKKASKKRGTIELELPEFRINFEGNRPKNILVTPNYISHKIIEEMMVLANSCAGKVLDNAKKPTIYRVHPSPDDMRFLSLTNALKSIGLSAPKHSGLTPHVFNEVLLKVKGSTESPFIQSLVLRSQAQASYTTDNIGHFGLSLKHYCHFTSPIRRYADLIVHRSLIALLDLDDAPITLDHETLENISAHISKTERIAATAEREAFERYSCQLLKDHEGEIMNGSITGVMPAGIFISIENYGVEGFMSTADLDDDYYIYEEEHHRFIGKRKKKLYQLGKLLRVKIINSDPILSEIKLKIMENIKKKPSPKKKISDNKTTEKIVPKKKYQGSKVERRPR